MIVYSIALFKVVQGSQPILLNIVYELSSFGFFQRSSVKEISLFVSRETVGRINVNERVSVVHEQSKKVCHATLDMRGLACAVLTDGEYPERVAHVLTRVAMDQFTQANGDKWKSATADTDLPTPQLEQTILRYQNPHEADPMLSLQKNLDETISIVKKTVEQLGQRGEKLEDLADKSNDLSFQSKAFMRNAESMNKCCSYM